MLSTERILRDFATRVVESIADSDAVADADNAFVDVGISNEASLPAEAQRLLRSTLKLLKAKEALRRYDDGKVVGPIELTSLRSALTAALAEPPFASRESATRLRSQLESTTRVATQAFVAKAGVADFRASFSKYSAVLRCLDAWDFQDLDWFSNGDDALEQQTFQQFVNLCVQVPTQSRTAQALLKHFTDAPLDGVDQTALAAMVEQLRLAEEANELDDCCMVASTCVVAAVLVGKSASHVALDMALKFCAQRLKVNEAGLPQRLRAKLNEFKGCEAVAEAPAASSTALAAPTAFRAKRRKSGKSQ